MANPGRVFCLICVPPLLIAGAATAQTKMTKPSSTYLDFAQFSTVVAADELSFGDKLWWEGMRFVRNPAAKRVVPLFKYKKDDATKFDCSDKRLQNNYALLLTRLWPRDAVVKASIMYPAMEAGVDILIAKPKGMKWFTKHDLAKANFDGETMKKLGIKAVPVWHGIGFANPCELKDKVTGLDYQAHEWRVITDPKLRYIATSGIVAKEPAIIATANLLEQKVGAVAGRQYFAECLPESQLQSAGATICSKKTKTQ